MSVEFYRGSPGKFDSKTLHRKTLNRWTLRSRTLTVARCSPSEAHGAHILYYNILIIIYDARLFYTILYNIVCYNIIDYSIINVLYATT